MVPIHENMKHRNGLAVALLLAERGTCTGVCAFCPGSRGTYEHASRRRSRAFQSNSGNDQPQRNEEADAEPADPREELAPPVFSLRRKSLLFNDSSPDGLGGNDRLLTSDLGKEVGSITLTLWSRAKSVLPPLLTGASEATSGDKDALGSLYNLLFVRTPTFFLGIGYLVNLVQGHPLIMDFGTGAFEVSPIVVLAALWAILRY